MSDPVNYAITLSVYSDDPEQVHKVGEQFARMAVGHALDGLDAHFAVTRWEDDVVTDEEITSFNGEDDEQSP